MEVQSDFLHTAVIYLGMAVVAVPLFKRLGLGAVLGYMVAGILIGPQGFDIVHEVDPTLHFSELGVVLLMFLIGLELNPAKLWQLRKPIFGLGTAQVALSILVLVVAGFMLGYSFAVACAAAVALALSSTSTAMQALEERGLSNTTVSQSSFSVLLFQDLAVIPILAFVPLLGMGTAADPTSFEDVLKTLGVFIGFIIGGRYLLRPIFRLIAETKIRELFTAFSLFLVIGSGLLMEAVDISMALGTFLAGVLLAESEYRHELELNIEPFKGLLLGLFFMAVGMSVDLSILFDRPLAILAVVAGFMLLKGFVIYHLGTMAGLTRSDRVLFALLLAQGGEFAFVVVALIQSLGIVDVTFASELVLIASLSMFITPFLLVLNEKVIMPRFNISTVQESDIERNEGHVIIAGYGRFGQIAGRVMLSRKIPVTVIDHDPNHIEFLRKYDFKVFYGDATRIDLLESAGADKAKLLILAMDNQTAVQETAAMVKRYFPDLPILARARNRMDLNRLKMAGVKASRRETFSSALEIAELALVELGYGAREAHQTVLRFRHYDERNIAGAAEFMEDEKSMIDYAKRTRAQLEEVMSSDQEELSNSDKAW